MNKTSKMLASAAYSVVAAAIFIVIYNICSHLWGHHSSVISRGSFALLKAAGKQMECQLEVLPSESAKKNR